jgi:hypothetical protein
VRCSDGGTWTGPSLAGKKRHVMNSSAQYIDRGEGLDSFPDYDIGPGLD